MAKKTAEVESSNLPGAFDLFKPSVDALSLNIVTWIQLIFVPLASFFVALAIVALFAGAKLDILAVVFGLAAGIAFVVYALLMGPTALVLQLRSAQGTRTDWRSAVQAGRHFFWRFYGLSICAGLLILGGFILLIVPGLYQIRRYFLAQYILVDTDSKVFDTLRASAAMSLRDKHDIWNVIGVEVLIGLIGIVPFIGQAISFVGNILYYFAPAIRYEQIKRLPEPVSQ
jgi:hypothetical protein